MHTQPDIYAPVADAYSVTVADGFTQQVDKRLGRLRLLSRVCRVLGIIILTLVVVIALGASVVPRLLGMQSYAIVTGSMESDYPTGSLVYAVPASGKSLEVGDVAAFVRDENIIVHRIHSIDTEKHELIAKGDANDGVDVRPVPYDHVLGRVVLGVPYAGYFLMAIGDTSGKLILGWVVLMGAALCLVGSVVNALAFQSETKRA